MSDGTNGQVAPSTAGQGGSPAAQGQPTQSGSSQFSVPQGYKLVGDDDYQKLSRYEQQVRGFQPFYEKAQKLGFKSAEDFDRYAPVIETVSKNKIDPRAFASMFSQEAEQDLNGGSKQPQFDVDSIKKQLLEEARLEIYQIQHQGARESEKKLLEKAYAELLGEGEHDDLKKDMARRWLTSWAEENRPTYPQGHPLAEKALAPLSEDILQKGIGAYRELETKVKASQMANVGAAANKTQKPTVGTAAGRGGAQGKPQTNTELRDGNKPSRESVEEAYANLKAGRGR